MNTNTKNKTILNIKTDKGLKISAQKIAEQMGIPLSTIMNAFLKQFVQEKEITFSVASSIRPSKMLKDIIKKANEDYKKGDV